MKRTLEGCPAELLVEVPCVLAGAGGRHRLRLRFDSYREQLAETRQRIEPDSTRTEFRPTVVSTRPLRALSCACDGREDGTEVALAFAHGEALSCLDYAAAIRDEIRGMRHDNRRRAILERLPPWVRDAVADSRRTGHEVARARASVLRPREPSLLDRASEDASTEAARIVGFGEGRWHMRLQRSKPHVLLQLDGSRIAWTVKRGIWRIDERGLREAAANASVHSSGQCPACWNGDIGPNYDRLRGHMASKPHREAFRLHVHRILAEHSLLKKMADEHD